MAAMDGFGFSPRTQADGAATIFNTAVTMADTLKSIVLAVRCSTLKDTQCFPPEHWSKPVSHMVYSPNYKRVKMYIPFICPEGIS